MFDAALRRLIDPPLNAAGRRLAARGVTAEQVTLAGLGCGLAAGAAIWAGAMGLALVLIALSRLADGLDGAVARARGLSDFGGLLDIAADFAFYAAVPLGFVLADPAGNGAAGTFLLASFYFNAATFLGFAALAARRGMETRAQGVKSLYYSNGLLEGSETIAFFVALCLFPGAFVPLAVIFALLCILTGVLRLRGARVLFGDGA